ncbi:MAG: autotransporter outer membrane beta-barrel domain-containing protein [Gammaproteobacteria bacterium]|nr:autotransporter outer membrane beta-barrel domain-containing protein [Gammaproteobacteria bacterium]
MQHEGNPKTKFIGELFSDPEGSGLIVRPGSDLPPVGPAVTTEDADVYICDKDGAEPDATAIPDESQPNTPYGNPGTYEFTAPAAENCAPLDSDPKFNDANNNNIQDDDENTLAGHRVLSVSVQGPSVIINANRVPEKGTYVAQLYIRVWDNDEDQQSSDFAKISVIVKNGANNHPSFAGSVGFATKVPEATVEHFSSSILRTSVWWGTTAMPDGTDATAWNAGDLDSGDVGQISYRVQDADGNEGKCWIERFPWQRWFTGYTQVGSTCWKYAPDGGNVTLKGLFVDYEALSDKDIKLRLVASDGFNENSVPITITVENENELDTNLAAIRALEGLRLLNDQESDPIDMNSLFNDPEDDALDFRVFSETRDDVVKTDGSNLILTGKGAVEGRPDVTNKITVIATDGDKSPQAEFSIVVRASNAAPMFEPDGILSVGLSIDENEPKGTLLKTFIQFSDEDSASEVEGIINSSVFDMVQVGVNSDGEACALPASGCSATAANELGLTTNQVLNFEDAEEYELSAMLDDGWDESSSLRVRVFVNDKNDIPTLTSEDGISDQIVAVDGSITMAVGDYFEDEDGDRLLITASGYMKSTVDVGLEGLDMVTVNGVKVGDTEITLTADDNNGGTVSTSFKVSVVENMDPVADEDVFAMRLPADNTINTGASHDIELAGLFSDPDMGDEIVSFDTSTSDEDVLLVVETNDGLTATIFGRDSGMATLFITAVDGGGNSATVEREITVNAAPEESMPLDPQTLDRVMPLAVDVSEIFSDSDDGADSLMIVAETLGEGADRATVEVMDGMLTITGVMGIAPGDVEIKLTATDPHGSKATSTFVATIENVDPTVAMSVDGQELDRTMPLDVDVNEVFADADGTVSSIVASVEEDSVISVGEIDIEDGMLTVTALAVGEATVTLSALDNDGGMVTDTFTVTVNNVNPVVANAVMDQSITRIMDGSVDISETFSDPDDDSMLAFSATTADDMIATVMVHDNMLSIEGLYVGTTTITVTATDVDGGMVSHDFMVEVENVTPTVAMSVDDQSFDRRAPLGIDLSDTFEDADGMIDSISAMVADGSVVEAVVDNGMLTLNALAVGDTTVTLTATDANGAMISDDFMVTVINIVPVVAEAVPDQSTTRLEDLMLDVNTTFDDPDADNTMLTISAMTEDGTVVDVMLEGTSLVVQGLAVGMTNITLTAVDADGGEVSDTFMATIENVDPVVANAVPDQSMDRRAPLMLDLSETFLDADNDATDITVMIGSGVVLSASDVEDMMLTITALAVGETAVTLTATDANGASVVDEFVVTVVNIDPVVASAVPDQTTTRVQDVMIDVSGVFADPDADDSMLSLEVMLSDGSIADASLNGSTLTIRGLDVGSTTLTLTATDADQGMVQSPFMVTIENVAPQVAGSISPITLEVGGQSASQAIAGLFSDDGDPLTYAIQSANGGIASASISGMTAMVGPVSRGSTTFTITATDPHGGVAMVNGSVTVGDGELKAVASKSLAGFARALLASASSSVGSRVMADARSSDLTLDAWAPSNEQNPMTTMSAEDRSEAAWNVANTATTEANANGVASSLSGMDTLRSMIGETFALNLGSSDNPSRWSVWGDVDRQSYEGEGYDGMASSVYLGADVTVAECWMFGVAVSSNSGESDYSWGTATQTMDLSLTTVLPYVSYQPSHRTSLWGVAGFGSGELDTTVVGASNDVSDLSSQLAMVGGSQNLTSVGRFDLALRGDAAMATLETDEGSGAADGLAADVNRVRVGLEGSFRTETGQGGMLEPFGQISLRSDGGDGDTGTGIEVAGGVRMTSDAFTLEVRGRTLAMHSADEYSESGFSLMATLNPSANATGISVSIAPRWGADAQGTGILWQDTLNSSQTYGALTGFGNAGAKASIDTQIGYGMLVAQENYLLTPFVDFAVSDGDRREMLFGASLRQLAQGNANLDINLALGRVEERTGATSGKVGLNATLRF